MNAPKLSVHWQVSGPNVLMILAQTVILAAGGAWYLAGLEGQVKANSRAVALHETRLSDMVIAQTVIDRRIDVGELAAARIEEKIIALGATTGRIEQLLDRLADDVKNNENAR